MFYCSECKVCVALNLCTFLMVLWGTVLQRGCKRRKLPFWRWQKGGMRIEESQPKWSLLFMSKTFETKKATETAAAVDAAALKLRAKDLLLSGWSGRRPPPWKTFCPELWKTFFTLGKTFFDFASEFGGYFRSEIHETFRVMVNRHGMKRWNEALNWFFDG